MITLVLASSSPYRRELLSRFKLPFDVFNPDIDESPRTAEKAKEKNAQENIKNTENNNP